MRGNRNVSVCRVHLHAAVRRPQASLCLGYNLAIFSRMPEASPMQESLDRSNAEALSPQLSSSAHELKFTIGNSRAPRIIAWLASVCRPDPEYLRAKVSSIYFDTLRWHALGEKLSSEYLKSKFRLRWYAAPGTPLTTGDPVFAEAKFRIGAIRRKLHVRAPYSAEWVDAVALEEPRLRDFPRFLQAQGVPVRHQLFPAFVVSYQRRRYIDPVSGARVCLDSEIGAPRVNSAVLPGTAPVRLETAVIEVKGAGADLPEHLHTLTDLGCRRTSFSKYAVCYQKMMGENF